MITVTILLPVFILRDTYGFFDEGYRLDCALNYGKILTSDKLDLDAFIPPNFDIEINSFLSWNFEIGILILSTWYLGQLGHDFAANPLLKIPIGT